MRRDLVGRAIRLCGMACAAVLTVCSSASAAVHVTSTADNTTSDGACTLREAVEAANAHASTADCPGVEGSGIETTIEVPANTYQLSSGPLEVTAGARVAIVGSGTLPEQTVIKGTGVTRVLETTGGGDATLRRVEVTGGGTIDGADATVAGTAGGQSVEGGGILNAGSMALEGVLVTKNFTGAGGSGAAGALEHGGGDGNHSGRGGGIYNSGSLEIIGSVIAANGTGVGGDGGAGGDGALGIGHFPDGSSGGDGGSAGVGGGIFNNSSGDLYIVDSTITGNFTGHGGRGGGGGNGVGEAPMQPAGDGGWGGEGGNNGIRPPLGGQGGAEEYDVRGGAGIANFGSLEAVSSTISENVAGDGGLGGNGGIGGKKLDNQFECCAQAGRGGAGGYGGGVLNLRVATLTNVTIVGNRAGNGGTGGANDQSGGGGGGIGGYGGAGGGIWTIGATEHGEVLHLTQATVSQNLLGAGGPGGASNAASGGSSAAGTRGYGAGLATGGNYSSHTGGGIHLENSVVANNSVTDVNCGQRGGPTEQNLHDDGNNVVWPDASCPGLHVDPKLGPLADNGGSTKTMMLEPGSGAIGAVPLGACLVHVDQRGVTRPAPAKAACDAGAVESGQEKGGLPTEEGGDDGGGNGGNDSGGNNGSNSSSNNSANNGSSNGGGSGGRNGGSPRAAFGVIKITGTTATMPLACKGPPGANCVLKLVLSVSGSKGAKSSMRARTRAKKKKKAITVGSTRVTLPAGATRSVAVKLNRRGKQMLSKGHKLKVRLTVFLAARPVLKRALKFEGR